MCGRYTNKKDKAFFKDQMGLEFSETKIEWAPHFNISPTAMAPVTIVQQPDKVGLMQFGCTPSWSPKSLFNAVGESIMEKKTFKPLMEKGNRCLVWADSYYEWKTEKEGKQPYSIYLKDRDLFSFAGVWGKGKDKDGNDAFVFYIITTTPNEALRDMHHRMPVILTPQDEQIWMDPDADIDELLAILHPYTDDNIQFHKVGKEVGNSRVNHPGLAEPI